MTLPDLVWPPAGAPDRTAVAEAAGSYSYAALAAAARRVAAALGTATGTAPADGGLAGARVAFRVAPGFAWPAVLLGIWRAGGVAVPLGLSHPAGELAYSLDDCQPAAVVAGGDPGPLAELAGERRLPLLAAEEIIASGGAAGSADDGTGEAAPEAAHDPGEPALILYTSGTTGRPKGAVHTHGSLAEQVAAMVEAWGWRADDRILHLLPLHHCHGIVNCLLTPLAIGASCELVGRFDAPAVWRRLAAGGISVLMAVPTIYSRLLAAWEEAGETERRDWSAAVRGLRLTVSGSAALPLPVLEAWRRISGHTLLERYGMTEIGMALSNPLTGTRVPGAVGAPMPGMEVRLVDGEGRPLADGTAGEIEVRGPQLFAGYWRRPDATRTAFRDGGWFVTGDEAVVEPGPDGPVHRILGRRSVDILKTGGYKVSALEIERVLAAHPAVAEVAVVGVADPEWGQRVAAAVVPRPGETPSLDELRRAASAELAPYKLPTLLALVDELPRNALGKVVKPALADRFTPAGK